LFYVRDNHPVDVAPRTRELLIGALRGAAVEEREVVITHDFGKPPRWVAVLVNGQRCTLDITRTDAPWVLRSDLRNALQFVQGHLTPTAPGVDPTERFERLEIAAANGMLSALDGRSALLDVETYRKLRADLPIGPTRAGADAGGARPEEAANARPAAAPPPALVSRLVAPGSAVGYVRLGTFGRGVAADLKRALTWFEAERVKGLVLDLRDNTGGHVDEAIAVADALIKAGSLGSMVSKERGVQQRKAFVARDDGYEPGGALVVLVNRRSAATSELVAAAIKNLGRGVILGEPTAGAASILVMYDVPKGPLRTTPPRRASSDIIQDVIDGTDSRPPAPPVQPDSKDVLGLMLATGRLLASGDAEIEGAGVIPDVSPTCPGGARPRLDDDCLVQLAKNLVTRARDPQRSSLLAIAKELATPAVAPPSTPQGGPRGRVHRARSSRCCSPLRRPPMPKTPASPRR
jgi:hypothetical protein